jgi:hypothetical protein
MWLLYFIYNYCRPSEGELSNILDCVSFGTSKVHGYQEPSMGVASLQVVLREDYEISMPSEISTTQIMPIVQLVEQKLPQVGTSVEDVVLVEDASDDEEVVSDAHVAIEDPILLITIEESSTHSMVEVEAREPRLTQDPPVEAVSSLTTTTSKREGLACLPTPSPPSTKTTTRRRKSYDRSSLRRCARLAQCNVLKDLSIIRGDGKFNEEAIQ